MDLTNSIHSGYAVTSRLYRTAVRIDREDWREQLPESLIDLSDKEKADYYRRFFSRDRIMIPGDWRDVMPMSEDGPTDFLKLKI